MPWIMSGPQIKSIDHLSSGLPLFSFYFHLCHISVYFSFASSDFLAVFFIQLSARRKNLQCEDDAMLKAIKILSFLEMYV